MSSAQSMRRIRLCTLMAAVALGGAAVPTYAGFALTGAATGYTLTTFATGFPTVADPNNAGIGALQVAVDPSQQVYVTDYANGGVYVFPNRTNGQTVASLPDTSFFVWGNFNANGIVQSGGHIYDTAQGASQIFDIAPTGYQNTSLWPGWSSPAGMVANPVTTGTYAVTTGSNTDQVHPGVFFSLGANADPNVLPPLTDSIEFMDPVQAELHNAAHPGTGLFVTSGTTATKPDSLAMSADGSVLYSVWSDGMIRAYSTATIPSGLNNDLWQMPGAGSIEMGTGNLAGMMFLSNGGELDEIDVNMADPNFGQKTIIATGGAYGGYLSADPFDGSLYITESDTVFRLAPPAGGGFVAAAEPSVVPEPASLALLAIAGASLLGLRGKRPAK